MSVNILWVAANKWGRHRDIFPHLPPSYLDKWQLLSAASRRWEILHEYAQNIFFNMDKNILRFAQNIFFDMHKNILWWVSHIQPFTAPDYSAPLTN